MSVTGSFQPARARLQRNHWKQLRRGIDGLGAWRHSPRKLVLIHSFGTESDGHLWEHVSLSRDDGLMPSWEQVRDVFHEVCGSDALGIIVVPPKAEHVNIAEVAHIWRCLTRRPLPDFTRGTGSI